MSTTNYDTYYRAAPRLQILQGWDPNEPRTRTRSAPVQSGVTIYSGQILALEWSSDNSEWEWVLADRDIAGHRAQAPAIAQDDSADYDVQAAGTLVGLSCSGQFEVQSAYFTTPTGGDQPLSDGVALTYGTGGTAGNIETTARGGGPTIPVIGIISGGLHAGPLNLGTSVNSAGVIIPGTNSEAAPANSNVVQWFTHYDSQNAAD